MTELIVNQTPVSSEDFYLVVHSVSSPSNKTFLLLLEANDATGEIFIYIKDIYFEKKRQLTH